MALDPRDFKRRRAEAEQKRAKQRIQQKRTLIKLAVAAGALIACGILILVVARPGSRKPAQTKPKETTQTVQTTAKKGKTTVIHLAAAGDLNINDAVVAAGGGSYDYSGAFMDVAHLLADADITALNFEGVVCGDPYGSSKSAPQSMLQTLAVAGVDLLQLANSYSIYKGVSGLADTIENVRQAGIEPLGVYADAEAAAEGKGYTMCQVQGVKIAFVAFTKGMDGMALPAGSENCVNVLYTDYASTYQQIDEEGITRVLEAVREEEPDITVAMLHWGSEFNDTLSSSQEKLRDLLLENGVDAIIGTHSHYVQKMEFDDDEGTFVAYSLGDFFGDAQRSGSEYSVILDLEITKNNETGHTAITNYSYTPIFTVAEEEKPLKVVRLREAMAAYEAGYIERVAPETYEAMKYAAERIEKRIKGE